MRNRIFVALEISCILEMKTIDSITEQNSVIATHHFRMGRLGIPNAVDCLLTTAGFDSQLPDVIGMDKLT
jgi:hypothetical protein